MAGDNVVYVPAAPKFDINDDWQIYAEILEQYFVANPSIEEDRKAAILLTSVSIEVYKIIKNAAFPDKPDKKTFSELCTLCKKQFSPVVSVFAERCRFYDARQMDGENVTDWANRVKKLSMQCDFGASMDIVLRDKFVCGMVKGPILERMCEMEKNATLAECIEAALKREMTVKEKTVLRECNKLDKYKQKNVASASRKKNSDSGARCFACARGDHDFKACKYRKFRCRKCDAVGHIAAACKQKDGSRKNSMNHLEPVNSSCDSSDSEQCELQLYCMASNDADDDRYYMTVKLNNRNVVCEVDSGAALSAMSERAYTSMFSHVPIRNTGVLLKAYEGTPIVPVGVVELFLEYRSRTFKCEFLVIRNGGEPLIGRDILRRLNIGFDMHAMDKSNDVQMLINEFSDIFRDELGCYKFDKVHFEVEEGTKPIFCKPRKVPLAFVDSVNKEIDRLIEQGVLVQVPDSKWGTPIVPILKKDSNSVRVCVDYKVTINRFLKNHKVEIPNIDDIFAKLNGGVYFTKLDLKNAFNQLELDDESQMLTAWSTQRGVFKNTRVPFGAKVSGAHFQEKMNKLLQDCDGAICFYDDILVAAETIEVARKRLRKVFENIREAGLRLNLAKCEFEKSSIKYLGHIIDRFGLRKDPEKVAAMVKAPRPIDVAGVQSYIGLINYYGHFFPNKSTVLAPLHKLLEKNTSFKWNDACEKSYLAVKEIVASDKVLVHYDSKLPVKLMSDASQYGIGAAIFHIMPNKEERPIAFASKSLNAAQRNYSTIDREALAIFFGVKRFSHYLLGRHFILQTDHRPLVAIFGDGKGIPAMAASRLQRWSVFLSSFDFSIEYVKGKNNVNADFLSRFPAHEEKPKSDNMKKVSYLNFIEQNITVDSEAIRKASAEDKVISAVIRYAQTQWPAKNKNNSELHPYLTRMNELTIESGVLMWGYRIVVPTKLRERVLKQLHSAHIGIVRMKALARSYCWWPNIDNNIEDMAKNCIQCLQNRPEQPKVQPSPWPKCTAPWQRIHIDHLGPFQGKTCLIIKDAYSKWIEIYVVNSLSAETTIEKLRDCFARFGIPAELVSDNGRSFTAGIFQQFCNGNGIKHTTSPPFHPQSNGAAENSVKTFKSAFLKSLSDPASKGASFETIMNRCLFAYRRSPHSVTKQSPFMMMFNREMSTQLDAMRPKPSKNSEENAIIKKQFEVGDYVMVRDYAVAKEKWCPAKVVTKVGNCMYKCQTERGVWTRHANQMMKSSANANKKVVICDIDFSNDLVPYIHRAGTQAIPNADPNEPNARVQPGSSSQFSGPNPFANNQIAPEVMDDRRKSTRGTKEPVRLIYDAKGTPRKEK